MAAGSVVLVCATTGGVFVLGLAAGVWFEREQESNTIKQTTAKVGTPQQRRARAKSAPLENVDFTVVFMA